MSSEKEERSRHALYLRADLSDEEYSRLVKELEADPKLLGELLRQSSEEDAPPNDSAPSDEAGESDRDALDEKIRKYLMHDPALTPEETARLEELLGEDDKYLERMSQVESELIEDHLRGALSAEEERRFNSHFLAVPERREKFRYIKALASAVPTKAREQARQPGPATYSPQRLFWQSLRAVTSRPKMLAAAAAVIILLLFVSVALWLRPEFGRHSPLVAEENPSQSTPQSTNRPPSDEGGDSRNALGTNNAASLTPTPAPTPPRNGVRLPTPNRNPRHPSSETAPPASSRTVFALVSGALRGGANVSEKRIEQGSKIVELRLRLDLDKDYDRYRVLVQDAEGREVAGRSRLKATGIKVMPTVVAALPAELFRPGDYTVILGGGKGGQYQEVGRYSFRILR